MESCRKELKQNKPSMKESTRFCSQQGGMDNFWGGIMENEKGYKYRCPHCGCCDSIKYRTDPGGGFYRIWASDPPPRPGAYQLILERKCANPKCRGNPNAPLGKKQLYYVEYYHYGKESTNNEHSIPD